MSHIDWGYIGYSEDPVSGSPDVIEQGGNFYRQLSNNLEQGAVHVGLMVNSTDAIVFETMSKVRANAEQMHVAMTDLDHRFAGVAGAMERYGPVLRDAQRQARSAAGAAIAAKRRYEQHDEEYRAHRAAMFNFDAERRAQSWALANSAASRANAANRELAEAHARIAAAVQARDTAADEAASAIDQAIKGSRFNDSWNDRVGEVVETLKVVAEGVGKWIWDNIDKISFFLDVVSLAFIWFPPAPLVLKGVAIAVKVAKFISVAKKATGIVNDLRSGNYAGAALSAAVLSLHWKIGRDTKTTHRALDKTVTSMRTKSLRGFATQAANQKHTIAYVPGSLRHRPFTADPGVIAMLRTKADVFDMVAGETVDHAASRARTELGLEREEAAR